jgi:GntR family transcriptional regulator
VLKAYRELEREGLAEGRRGLGTFVTKSLSSAATTGDDAPLRQELTGWMGRARQGGLVVEDVDALYTAVRDEHFPAEERA